MAQLTYDSFFNKMTESSIYNNFMHRNEMGYSKVEDIEKKTYLHLIDVATEAHKLQRRKGTDEPYITHPIAVAEFIEEQHLPYWVCSVAVMHDVVEDTHMSLADVAKECAGDMRIVVGVDALTDYDRELGNRQERLAASCFKLASAHELVRLVKVSDIRHNCLSISEIDEPWTILWLMEKRYQLERMYPKLMGDIRRIDGLVYECSDIIISTYFMIKNAISAKEQNILDQYLKEKMVFNSLDGI